MKFTTALAVLLSVSITAFAVPVGFTARDVWSPQITYPTAGAIWKVGQTYRVQWYLDLEPPIITNPTGTIYLAKGGLLDLDHPLAKGFWLDDGYVNVTIMTTFGNGSAPTTIAPGNDYAVVLAGDSGNFSPMFQITN